MQSFFCKNVAIWQIRSEYEGMTRDKEAARLFWQRFDDELKKKNIQLRDVAARSLLSYGSLAGWRSKHLFPDVEAIVRLSGVVDCSIDYLLGLHGPVYSPRIQTIIDILQADEKKLSALESLWDIDQKKAGSSGTRAS